jgi:hypothetical protein
MIRNGIVQESLKRRNEGRVWHLILPHTRNDDLIHRLYSLLHCCNLRTTRLASIFRQALNIEARYRYAAARREYAVSDALLGAYLI